MIEDPGSERRRSGAILRAVGSVPRAAARRAACRAAHAPTLGPRARVRAAPPRRRSDRDRRPSWREAWGSNRPLV